MARNSDPQRRSKCVACGAAVEGIEGQALYCSVGCLSAGKSEGARLERVLIELVEKASRARINQAVNPNDATTGRRVAAVEAEIARLNRRLTVLFSAVLSRQAIALDARYQVLARHARHAGTGSAAELIKHADRTSTPTLKSAS